MMVGDESLPAMMQNLINQLNPFKIRKLPKKQKFKGIDTVEDCKQPVTTVIRLPKRSH